MNIFVLTSDKYLDALKPFCYLFNKYWGKDQGVIIAGFTKPDFELPPNFAFHSIGEFSDYPVNKWSDSLIDLMDQHSHIDTSIIMLEDYWLTRPVLTVAVHTCYDYMRQFRYVLKMCLTGDRLYSAGVRPYGHAGPVDLVVSDPDSQYQMSMMTGIWNHEQLRKVLIPGETPWEVEIEGTPRVRELKDEMIVLGTRQWPVRHTLALRGGNTSQYLFDELDPGTIRELIEYECFSSEARAQAEEYLSTTV
jgi:hypothetical protein